MATEKKKKLTRAEKKAEKVLRILISDFIALTRLHKLVQKAEKDVVNKSSIEEKAEIKEILKKLRGLFGEERAARKLARFTHRLITGVKQAETELFPGEVYKINNFLNKIQVFDNFIISVGSRGGEIEDAIKKAAHAAHNSKIDEEKEDLRRAEEIIIKTIQADRAFEIEIKNLLNEFKEIEEKEEKVKAKRVALLTRRQFLAAVVIPASIHAFLYYIGLAGHEWLEEAKKGFLTDLATEFEDWKELMRIFTEITKKGEADIKEQTRELKEKVENVQQEYVQLGFIDQNEIAELQELVREFEQLNFEYDTSAKLEELKIRLDAKLMALERGIKKLTEDAPGKGWYDWFVENVVRPTVPGAPPGARAGEEAKKIREAHHKRLELLVKLYKGEHSLIDDSKAVIDQINAWFKSTEMKPEERAVFNFLVAEYNRERKIPGNEQRAAQKLKDYILGYYNGSLTANQIEAIKKLQALIKDTEATWESIKKSKEHLRLLMDQIEKGRQLREKTKSAQDAQLAAIEKETSEFILEVKKTKEELKKFGYKVKGEEERVMETAEQLFNLASYAWDLFRIAAHSYVGYIMVSKIIKYLWLNMDSRAIKKALAQEVAEREQLTLEIEAMKKQIPPK